MACLFLSFLTASTFYAVCEVCGLFCIHCSLLDVALCQRDKNVLCNIGHSYLNSIVQDQNDLAPVLYRKFLYSYLGGFVIYGGKLADGSFSDELWFYNVTERTWSLRAISSVLRPPRLTRHTLTLAGGDGMWLYLFGGSTVGGEFSSKLFRIRLSLGETAYSFVHVLIWNQTFLSLLLCLNFKCK